MPGSSEGWLQREGRLCSDLEKEARKIDPRLLIGAMTGGLGGLATYLKVRKGKKPSSVYQANIAGIEAREKALGRKPKGRRAKGRKTSKRLAALAAEHPVLASLLAGGITGGAAALGAHKRLLKMSAVDVARLEEASDIPHGGMYIYSMQTGTPIEKVAMMEKTAIRGWLAKKFIRSASPRLSGWAGRVLAGKGTAAAGKATKKMLGRHGLKATSLRTEIGRLMDLSAKGNAEAGLRAARLRSVLNKKLTKIKKPTTRAQALLSKAEAASGAAPTTGARAQLAKIEAFLNPKKTPGGGSVSASLQKLKRWVLDNPGKATALGVGGGAAGYALTGSSGPEPGEYPGMTAYAQAGMQKESAPLDVESIPKSTVRATVSKTYASRKAREKTRAALSRVGIKYVTLKKAPKIEKGKFLKGRKVRQATVRSAAPGKDTPAPSLTAKSELKRISEALGRRRGVA
jgi:hypothetical protein